MENRNFTVYYHVFPNGKKYVGITCLEVEKRWRNGNGYHGQPVYNAIKKYGWDNIEHNIYLINLTHEEANKLEHQLIHDWDTLIINGKGYNVSTAEYYNNGDVGRKEVSQYDIKGNLIKTYRSIREASYGVHALSDTSICECCNGHISISNGFQWRFGHELEIEPLVLLPKMKLRIDKFDLQGNYIASFNNATEAGRTCSDNKNAHIHIIEVCLGKRHYAYGYQWRYSFKDNNDCGIILPKGLEVSIYSLTGELIATFESIREAVRQTGISRDTIQEQCRKNRTTASEYYFSYGHDNYITIPKRYVDKLKHNIYCYDIQTRKFVKEYESNALAALELTGKKDVGNITSAVTGKRNNAYGYIWSYIKWDIAPENYRELNYLNYQEYKNKEGK